ncbi:hypothetical protein [Treponema sp. R6D11]
MMSTKLSDIEKTLLYEAKMLYATVVYFAERELGIPKQDFCDMFTVSPNFKSGDKYNVIVAKSEDYINITNRQRGEHHDIMFMISYDTNNKAKITGCIRWKGKDMRLPDPELKKLLLREDKQILKGINATSTKSVVRKLLVQERDEERTAVRNMITEANAQKFVDYLQTVQKDIRENGMKFDRDSFVKKNMVAFRETGLKPQKSKTPQVKRPIK